MKRIRFQRKSPASIEFRKFNERGGKISASGVKRKKATSHEKESDRGRRGGGGQGGAKRALRRRFERVQHTGGLAETELNRSGGGQVGCVRPDCYRRSARIQ